MLGTVDQTTALRELALEHAEVRALINSLNDEEMTRPNTIEYGLYPDQELSFKDLLAHLTTYEVLTLEAIDLWQQGEKHYAINELQTEAGRYRIHHEGIVQRTILLSHLLDQSEAARTHLMETLQGLSAQDWVAKAPFTTTEPLDLSGMVEIILVTPPRPPYRHLPVHIPDTDAYIRKLRANKKD